MRIAGLRPAENMRAAEGAGHSFSRVNVLAPAQTLALKEGMKSGAVEPVGAPRLKPNCSCGGACSTSANPNGRISGEPTTQDAGAGPAAPAPAPAGPAPAGPVAPARRAELQSGPTYTPRGAIAPAVAGGFKSAGPWNMDAVFKHDPANGIFAGCGEVHQDLKWDAAAAASFNALYTRTVPHLGFPAAHPANTWIEDRDNTDNLRYGRRTGPHAVPVAGGNEYTNAAGVQDMRHGRTFHANDNPSNWPAALTGRWAFMLLAFDMCNGGVQIGQADFITINW
jgi:hypothetical protein